MLTTPSMAQRMVSAVMPSHSHILPSLARKGEGCSSPRRMKGRLGGADVFICTLLVLALG